ncbi:MAG: hypothetical protein LKJ69_12785 [Lactobacillus sp.]|nr:hypothetical protein [Lactobacillus sp.]MCI2034242.1 hypothetical protein [Lactobacillus sp.]
MTKQKFNLILGANMFFSARREFMPKEMGEQFSGKIYRMKELRHQQLKNVTTSRKLATSAFLISKLKNA